MGHSLHTHERAHTHTHTHNSQEKHSSYVQLCGVKANVCCLPQQLSIFSESGSLPKPGDHWVVSSRDRAGSMSPVLCCGLLCGCWGSLVVQGLYPLIESPGAIEHNMLFRKLQLWTWTRITVLPCPGLCGRAGGSGIGSGHTTTWESQFWLKSMWQQTVAEHLCVWMRQALFVGQFLLLMKIKYVKGLRHMLSNCELQLPYVCLLNTCVCVVPKSPLRNRKCSCKAWLGDQVKELWGLLGPFTD